MKSKTINKVLNNKMLEWIESISDKSLVADLKSDIIVTGGAIVSMFLQKDVNDFDVYIRKRDTLIKLVKYYAKPFKDEIEVIDNIDYFKKKVENLIKNESDNSELDKLNGYNALLKGMEENQIGLYILNGSGIYNVTEDGVKKRRVKSTSDKRYQPIIFTQNAISLTDKIQIILRFYGEPEEVHKNFDFVHAKNYWTFKDGLVTNTNSLESILSKTLRYEGSLYPVASLFRMKKFLKRGWDINAGEILKIAYQVSHLDLDKISVLSNQIISVDISYFDALLSRLRNLKKKENFSEEYLFKIIDEIFNT